MHSSNCRHAAEWVEANKPLFCAKVDLPDVLGMGEEEQAEAALQYGRLWNEELDENERETNLEPFKFTFHNPDDMWRFCDEIIDNKIIRPIVNVALSGFVCENKDLQKI